MHNPFARKRPNPKRTEPRRTGDRVRLKGYAMTDLRLQAFERSAGYCEATIERFAGPLRFRARCGRPIIWETMELMHTEHGPRRSDTLATVLAGCKECHRNEHNAGGKPVARKPGRRMNQKEAVAYWKGTKCWCGKEEKASGYSFGPTCWAKLSPQSQYDLLNTLGEDYIQAIALAEIEVLAWKPAEEKECSPTIAETK